MADACVVGLDVGGTHSRAVLATAGGRVLGSGRAGGGNPTVLGAGPAIANIVAALKAALGETPGKRVEACVVGLAGVSTLMADPQAPRVLEQAWADAGLACPVRIVSDVTVSFAAGTPHADGTLLVSGTGAVAARMHDRLPARFRDGYGWLLGDDGSGFWIGRQAARATIAAVDGRAPMAELAKAVLAALLDPEPGPDSSPTTGRTGSVTSGRTRPETGLGGRGATATATEAAPTAPSAPDTAGPDTAGGPAPSPAHQPSSTPSATHPPAPVPRTVTPATTLAATIGEGFTLRGRRRASELVRAVTAQPTVALARLAPLVMAAYELGDPAARRIVEEAARVLVDSLAGVGPVAGEPVVLGGSVLVSRSPVFDAVAAAVGRRWPDSPVSLAHDGAAGATWLAARDLLGEQAAARIHAAFTGDPGPSAKFS
ncbi:N-acetylglucosamine kinase [Catenulispora subtropica]|uniref:ATPase BadF/BadG/BcrA/BcrD type domain-containing protein n=1 Tax=Catenulispora subtropica TaxID=450798 RepID=A0ABN2SS74_9ACTN